MESAREYQTPDEMLPYLVEISKVLGRQLTFLSLDGKSHDRSPMGRINDLSTDTLFLLAGGERVFSSEDSALGNYEYFKCVRHRLDNGEVLPPKVLIARKPQSILNKLGVILEWGNFIIHGQSDYLISDAQTPAGEALVIVRRMIDPLTQRQVVSRKWNRLNQRKSELELYYRFFQLELKDAILKLRDES
jgi:hypothetical protein